MVLCHITKIIQQNPPYISMKYDYNINNWRLMGGSEYKLLQILSTVFNFTYSVVNCEEEWGTLLPNKTWTGIIGTLNQGVSDLVIWIGEMSFWIISEESRYRSVRDIDNIRALESYWLFLSLNHNFSDFYDFFTENQNKFRNDFQCFRSFCLDSLYFVSHSSGSRHSGFL